MSAIKLVVRIKEYFLAFDTLLVSIHASINMPNVKIVTVLIKTSLSAFNSNENIELGNNMLFKRMRVLNMTKNDTSWIVKLFRDVDFFKM
jgi:hypothetical protein